MIRTVRKLKTNITTLFISFSFFSFQMCPDKSLYDKYCRRSLWKLALNFLMQVVFHASNIFFRNKI